MQPTYTKMQEPMEVKKFEKPILKYVKSSKDMVRNDNLGNFTQYKKIEQPKVEDEYQKE
jgi:hypothetical protein